MERLAETQGMAEEEMVAYSQSLQKLKDTQAGIDYARKESYNDGREEGREEGRAEGLAEGLHKSAVNMLKAGLNPEFIHEITEMSIDEIIEIGQSLKDIDN